MNLIFFLFLFTVIFLPTLFSQTKSFYAKKVVYFKKGDGPGIYNTKNILGPPKGGGYYSGSYDVLTLGIGGSVVLGFDVEICNLPGADFIVFENPFFALGTTKVFAELAYVEVSTDGKTFARFPSRFNDPSNGSGPFGTLQIGSVKNLAGMVPVLANSITRPQIDPRNPCLAGGDAFDLEDLKNHPYVKSGKVNLMRIRYIKIIDVISGKDKDSRGRIIYDPGNGADIDAVAVINYRGKINQGMPGASIIYYKNSIYTILWDPNGIFDLDFSRFRFSFDSFNLDPFVFFKLFKIKSITKNSILFCMDNLAPNLVFTMGISIKDKKGFLSGIRRSIP